MHWKTEIVSCPICSSSSSIPLFNNDSHGFGLHSVLCEQCSLVYFNPRPTEAEYQRLYTGIYEKLFPSAWDLKLAEFKAERRLQWYRNYLTPGSNLLEVGPGDGAFLKLLKQQTKVTISGVEPSPDAVAVCHRRGLAVQQGYFEPTGQTFNTLAAFHVLEHSLSPVSLLCKFWHALNDDGMLFIEVPNIMGRWNGLGMIHIAHPQQFCPASLSIALDKAGFDIVSIDAIEEPVFESSIRAIAKKTANHKNQLIEPPIQEIEWIFSNRLANWKTDLLKYRAKRFAYRISGFAALQRAMAMRRLSAA